MEFLIVSICMMVISIVLLFMSIKVIHEDEFAIVERFGAFQGTKEFGLHITPFIDRVIKYSKKDQTIDINKLSVKTMDREVNIDVFIKFRIEDVKLYHYGTLKDKSLLLRNLITQSINKELESTTCVNLKLDIQEFTKRYVGVLAEHTPSVGIKIMDLDFAF